MAEHDAVQWRVQVSSSFGALFANDEQVRLPGPVVGLEVSRPLVEPWLLRRREPIHIVNALPEVTFTVAVRPHAGSRIMLLDGTRMISGEGGFSDMTCPTCLTRHSQ